MTSLGLARCNLDKTCRAMREFSNSRRSAIGAVSRDVKTILNGYFTNSELVAGLGF